MCKLCDSRATLNSRATYRILGRLLAVLLRGAATHNLLPGGRQGIPLQIQVAQTTQLTEANGQVLQTIVVQVQVAQLLQLPKVLGQEAYLILAQIQPHQTRQNGEVFLCDIR